MCLNWLRNFLLLTLVVCVPSNGIYRLNVSLSHTLSKIQRWIREIRVSSVEEERDSERVSETQILERERESREKWRVLRRSAGRDGKSLPS